MRIYFHNYYEKYWKLNCPSCPFYPGSLLAVAALFLTLLSPVDARDYYVSPAGEDAAPGTREQPFRTLAKACEVVEAGDTCWLREGVYRETLRPKHSGEEGKPIVFRGWAGERAILSGLDPVTGWQSVPNSPIWEAPMAWDLKVCNQVFRDGQMLFEARWPHKQNNNPMDPEGAIVRQGSGSDNQSFVCDTLPDFAPDVWQGAWVWMLAHEK